MTVIAMNRTSMQINQYDTVTNIAVSGSNYVISYGSSQTASLPKTVYTIHIMES